jgi:class 3 adenylate cyclase
VPQIDSVNLSNDTVQIRAAVMFADLASSTTLVRDHDQQFASHVIKVFLSVASRSIRDSGGEIRSFDGDRVMGVFTGADHAESATRAALQLRGYMMAEAVPRLERRWNFNTAYRIGYGCGVDAGDLHVVRTGVRSYNDLVFLGIATINAAKLAQERIPGLPISLTSSAHTLIQNTNLLRSATGQPVWSSRYSPSIGGTVYSTDAWINA